MDNSLIADAFEEMAELLELQGENPFRVRAYRSGAKAIRELDESIADILADPKRDLKDVPVSGRRWLINPKRWSTPANCPSSRNCARKLRPCCIA